MFKTLKGNKYAELLSTNNKKLIEQWKLHSDVKKGYDAQAKTFVFSIGGKSPVAKLALPKDRRKKLDLPYPLLVLQLYFPAKSNILFNIGITSMDSQRKRISFSSIQKSKHSSPLSAVVPFAIEIIESWTHVIVDIEDIVSNTWNNANFKTIDSMTLSGVFNLKRIFLLSRNLVEFREGIGVIKYDQLPKEILLPKCILQSFKYVSSSCETSEYLKELNLENFDLSSTRSSRASEMSSLSRTSQLSSLSGRYSQQEIKSDEEYSNAENIFRETDPQEKSQISDDGFLFNLSTLSFSGRNKHKLF